MELLPRKKQPPSTVYCSQVHDYFFAIHGLYLRCDRDLAFTFFSQIPWWRQSSDPATAWQQYKVVLLRYFRPDLLKCMTIFMPECRKVHADRQLSMISRPYLTYWAVYLCIYINTCRGAPYLDMHHHQPATAVLKTRRLNIYCRDTHFCRQQEQTCGQQQSSYAPNSTAAKRDWKRQPHPSCRLDSQCSGDREDGKNLEMSPKQSTIASIIIALFFASDQIHSALVVCNCEWVTVVIEVITTLFRCCVAGATWVKLLPSRRTTVLCAPYNHAPDHCVALLEPHT